MDKKKLDFRDIGVEGIYTYATIPSISQDVVCVYKNKEKTLFSPLTGNVRGRLHLESLINHGSYGNIYLAKRIVDLSETTVYVKQPRFMDMSLAQEGILQHLAHTSLAKQGMSWAIPQVFDIFQKDGQVCFSMERVEGITLFDWVIKQDTSTFTNGFYLLLAQICLLIWYLETELGFDHRDLKVNNLFIRQLPSVVKLQIAGKLWTLNTPFQVVIIDFGFACIGSANKHALVNLGDGVLPPMDPCPKDGRDIFHILISLMTLPSFQAKISSSLRERIDGWLSVGQTSYGSLARRYSQENWVYLVTSQRHFSVPHCNPCTLLEEVKLLLPGHLSCSPLA
jgi:serine/threonine protein kinase